MSEPTYHVKCPCGWTDTVERGVFLADTPPSESAQKRAAAHSVSCAYDYDEITVETSTDD